LANKQRGYVDIELDRPRKLQFTTNALAELEDALGYPVSKINEDNTGINTIRAMLWAGLLHEMPDLTLKEAGELRDYISFKEASEKLHEALELAFGTNQEKNKVSGLSGVGAS
jgi:hypothetical protein